MQRTILKDLLAKKGIGTLKLDAYRQRLSQTLAEVELSRIADDPYVHFGDVVQLVHVDTGCVLAGDPGEQDTRPGEQSCLASAAPDVRAPCARNTLILTKYVAPKSNASVLDPEYDDDVLHYGQKVRVVLYPSAYGPQSDVTSAGGPRPLCLFSKPISTTHAAKYSRQQLVGFTYRADSYDCVWQVVTPDPAMRAASEGVEVAVGAPLLLVHCATQKPLCVEAAKVPTDYGIELEVSARSAMNNGLKLACEQATMGVLKGFLPKGEQSDNHWVFVGGSRVAQLPQPSNEAQASASMYVEGLVTELAGRGQGALSLLERKLVTLESSSSSLTVPEFKLILRQLGSVMPDDGVAALAARFSTGRAGQIDCGELRRALRGAMGAGTGA